MRGWDSKRGGGLITLTIRALVSIYWVALAIFGCARLWREGWGSSLAVIHAWYLAALAFLLVWGPVTIVASLATAKGEAKAISGRHRSGAYRLRG